MNKEAKNMEAIYKAKQQHDATCRFGGIGVRIYMTAFDIERMGWEEGDVIAGLTLVIDHDGQTGRFRVECDAEPNDNSSVHSDAEIADPAAAKRDPVRA